MPLQLEPISQRLEELAHRMVVLAPAKEKSLRQARSFLQSTDPNALRQKLSRQRLSQVRFPWLTATPLGSLDGTFEAPAPPSDFSVVGSDASSLESERGDLARYFAINVGCAWISYGRHPDAVLKATNRLAFQDDELYVFPDQRQIPIEGALLGALMEVESVTALSKCVGGVAQRPLVAMRDGPLVLWALQNESDQVQRVLLESFFQALGSLRDSQVPLAGYISHSAGRDVMNSIRVWLCQRQPGACDACKDAQRALCIAWTAITDSELFDFLRPGERSDLFGSSSKILDTYGDHRADFFYLNVGGEIARVEVPRWVGEDTQMLTLLHASLYDQCKRSACFPPYPPALQEAHEQAVITAAERRLVENMVEQALTHEGLPVTRSAKDDSKRRRWV